MFYLILLNKNMILKLVGVLQFLLQLHVFYEAITLLIYIDTTY